MSDDIAAVAFLDLETSGLDPDKDRILEVGIYLTLPDLSEIDTFQRVVRHKDLDLMRMSPTVVDMHIGNGLIQDITNPNFIEAAGAGSIDAETRGWLSERVFGGSGDFMHPQNRGRIRLAGSGVSHFDVRFLRRHLPETFKLFHRATLDAGVLRRAFELVGREDVIPTPLRHLDHRALDDAMQHHAEMCAYLEVLRKAEL